MADSASYLDGPHGRLAYRLRQGTSSQAPGLVWLGGFRSDMCGTKAAHLDAWAADAGRRYLRFDYSGHGESGGAFEDGSIGDWLRDAETVFDRRCDGPQILIGSSMGGWIATLLALARKDQIAGVVFIAPAPDFTERLMWPSFSDAQRQTLMAEGRLELPSDYSDEPDVITRKLIEDGRRHLVMNTPVRLDCPVWILQGMKDDAVPYQHALEFAGLITGGDVTVTLTPNGDHRLSTPADLDRLIATVEAL